MRVNEQEIWWWTMYLSSGYWHTYTHIDRRTMPLKLQLLCVPDCLPFATLHAAFQCQNLFISSIHSFFISLFHSALLFPYIQKTKICRNFTEIWLTLSAFREARANVLWRILNLDMWSSTDCERENSSPHLIRQPRSGSKHWADRASERISTLSPCNKGFPWCQRFFSLRYQDHLTAKCEDRKTAPFIKNNRSKLHSSSYWNTLTECTVRVVASASILGDQKDFWCSAVHENFEKFKTEWKLDEFSHNMEKVILMQST